MHAHQAIQDVDLEIAELQHRRERHRLVVGAPHDHQHPREQLLG